MIRRLIPVLVLAALPALVAAPLAAATPVDRFTPLAARVLAAPEPVLASDGKRHLAYELELIDHAAPGTKATVRRVETIADGKVVDVLRGRRLRAVTKPFGATKPGTTLQAGEAGTILVDLTFPRRGPLPRRLVHRLVVGQTPANPVSASSFLAAPTAVGHREAIVVAPPLRGPGWVVGNGCCAEATSHRGGVLSINGALHTGERYAIDFFQIAPSGFLAEGPREQLSSYPYFGAPVLSATSGRVVGVRDGLPDGPITLNLPPITAADAGGNHVVVALGHHRFAYYAHLQPGSVRVRVGDRVEVGETLGLLGNSGNSNAPHLHFQLMDGPIPLGSNGIPYRFTRFATEGTLKNFIPVFAFGARAQVQPTPTGPHAKELPLDLEVLNFR